MFSFLKAEETSLPTRVSVPWHRTWGEEVTPGVWLLLHFSLGFLGYWSHPAPLSRKACLFLGRRVFQTFCPQPYSADQIHVLTPGQCSPTPINVPFPCCVLSAPLHLPPHSLSRPGGPVRPRETTRMKVLFLVALLHCLVPMTSGKCAPACVGAASGSERGSGEAGGGGATVHACVCVHAGLRCVCPLSQCRGSPRGSALGCFHLPHELSGS